MFNGNDNWTIFFRGKSKASFKIWGDSKIHCFNDTLINSTSFKPPTPHTLPYPISLPHPNWLWDGKHQILRFDDENEKKPVRWPKMVFELVTKTYWIRKH
jgi:hypothetical protein